jgi:hypothetical protein
MTQHNAFSVASTSVASAMSTVSVKILAVNWQIRLRTRTEYLEKPLRGVGGDLAAGFLPRLKQKNRFGKDKSVTNLQMSANNSVLVYQKLELIRTK